MAKKKSYNVSERHAAKKSGKSIWMVGFIILSAAILILAILELTNTTHILHKQKVPAIIPASNALKKSSGGNSSITGSPSPTTPSSSTGDKTPTSGGNLSNLPLIAPYGTFVSNHHPDDSTGLGETSSCNTTPGASCYIKFTNINSGETTRLPSQTANSDGSAGWNWDVSKDAHLSSGNWRVTAVATLSGQTKSTDDPNSLVIE
jgi:hypothetical protein